MMDVMKRKVHNFWDKASCGEQLYLSGSEKSSYIEQGRIRYELEPYIIEFADFNATRDLDVLEIGVGLGADHQRFAEAGARLHGIDLTERAINHTLKRLELFDLRSDLQIGDAEELVFGDEKFDVVYSWGVLQHTPNTQKAIEEVHRVLRSGGIAKIMMYHKWSFVGFMLWVRYALLRLRPFASVSEIYAKYLQGPGTKAYSVAEARRLFQNFRSVEIRTVLTHGDLLSSQAGQRHGGILLEVARRVWPCWLIKNLFPRNGLYMLITATK
jgi:ubiquinone/menaquinone biosynthesis C-methylase UbiE